MCVCVCVCVCVAHPEVEELEQLEDANQAQDLGVPKISVVI